MCSLNNSDLYIGFIMGQVTLSRDLPLSNEHVETSYLAWVYCVVRYLFSFNLFGESKR